MWVAPASRATYAFATAHPVSLWKCVSMLQPTTLRRVLIFSKTSRGVAQPSVAILFNTKWGLQVCSPDGDRWEYVPPSRNDLAIVNIGDALKFISGLKLKSCLHRVVPCYGKWEAGPRYATIFFLRPNNDAEFTDTEGQRWKAGDWLNRKFLNYRAPHSDQERNAITTGRKGFVGLWEKPVTALVGPT
jgi:2OG-Fe(II) oxygenase superfamily